MAAEDPRGEIITLGIAGRGEEMDRLFEIYEEELFGDAVDVRNGEVFEDLTWTGGWEGATPRELEVALDYDFSRYGMIDTITITGLDEEGHLAKAVGRLISAPIGRFVRLVKISLGEVFSGPSGLPNYDNVFAMITRARPLSLRCIEIDTGGYQISWTDTGSLGPLLATARRIEEIDIEHGRISFGKKPVDLPNLRSLRLESGGLPAETIQVIASSHWPSLERMTIFFGAQNYGGNTTPEDLKGIFERPHAFPSLKHLALCNSEIQGAIAAGIATSPLLAQLKTLDLSKGILEDSEANVLIEHAKRFKHLERLDISENYLSPAIVDSLKALLPNVVAEGQRYDEMLQSRAQYGSPEWATTGFRYTTIGE
jgi:hypothetical protein